jgi:hypothetical protein
MTLILAHSASSDFFHFILSYLVRPAPPQFFNVQISIRRWSCRIHYAVLFPFLLLLLGNGVGKLSAEIWAAGNSGKFCYIFYD